MVLVFTEHFERKYFAPRFSLVYLYCLAISLVVIFLPFFIAFTTESKCSFMIIDFWVKTKVAYETPKVTFRNEILLQILQSDGKVRSFSSLRFLNEELTNQSEEPLAPSITTK
jgi:hypothetical protein